MELALVVYVLCALTSLACAVLLLRGWRRSRQRLLLWSGLCFVFLTLNNILLFLDVVVFPVEVDLRPYRLAAALIAVGFLLYGFVWESE